VDLIRSDLLSCCTPSTVTVPKLIALESYGVHNLVTTVRGKLASNVGSVEAVRRCFPPGASELSDQKARLTWKSLITDLLGRLNDRCTEAQKRAVAR
jgi:hypothetical protein